MLIFANLPLPQHELTYAAFRLACLETRERLELAHQLDLNPERNFGYLTEVPFLRNVPVQVQLQVLLETWKRHLELTPYRATMLDESVLYAACETAARVTRTEPDVARRFLARGPLPAELPCNITTADRLQQLHLEMAGDGRFLLLSQFLDLPPDLAFVMKQNTGLTDPACEPMFEILGRWYASEAALEGAQDLLTRVETDQLRWLFNAARCCHPG